MVCDWEDWLKGGSEVGTMGVKLDQRWYWNKSGVGEGNDEDVIGRVGMD
jgi:hypothetical protein